MAARQKTESQSDHEMTEAIESFHCQESSSADTALLQLCSKASHHAQAHLDVGILLATATESLQWNHSVQPF